MTPNLHLTYSKNEVNLGLDKKWQFSLFPFKFICCGWGDSNIHQRYMILWRTDSNLGKTTIICYFVKTLWVQRSWCSRNLQQKYFKMVYQWITEIRLRTIFIKLIVKPDRSSCNVDLSRWHDCFAIGMMENYMDMLNGNVRSDQKVHRKVLFTCIAFIDCNKNS